MLYLLQVSDVMRNRLQQRATQVKPVRAKLIDKTEAIRARWWLLMNSRFAGCKPLVIVTGINYSRGFYVIYWIDDDTYCGVRTFDGFCMIYDASTVIEGGSLPQEVWDDAMLGKFPVLKMPFSRKVKRERRKLQ